jgi:hypothetical protein
MPSQDPAGIFAQTGTNHLRHNTQSIDILGVIKSNRRFCLIDHQGKVSQRRMRLELTGIRTIQTPGEFVCRFVVVFVSGRIR